MSLFDEVATAAWQQAKTPLEQMYDIWTCETWEPDPPHITYRIWDRETGLPIGCHLEGCVDQWVLCGLESQHKATVFVCDHGYQVAGPGVAIPKVSSVPVGKVGRYEIVGEMRE